MSFLLDTDVLSNLVKRATSPRLVRELKGRTGEMFATTAVNTAEIYFGAARSDHGDKIRSVFEEKVFPQLTILPFDAASAVIFGGLKALLEKRGAPRSEPDLRIAAIALQHRLTLITGNIRHFTGIPRLRIENWLED